MEKYTKQYIAGSGLQTLQDDGRTMAIGQFEHQGVAIHPGDYGMECIAKRILKTLDFLTDYIGKRVIICYNPSLPLVKVKMEPIRTPFSL